MKVYKLPSSMMNPSSMNSVNTPLHEKDYCPPNDAIIVVVSKDRRSETLKNLDERVRQIDRKIAELGD